MSNPTIADNLSSQSQMIQTDWKSHQLDAEKYITTGNQLLEQGNVSEAITYYDRATKLDPPNLSEPYFKMQCLINTLTEQGQLDSAITCMQKLHTLRGWHLSGSQGYQFTRDWFTNNVHIWKRYLKPLVGKPGVKVLEIGSFEGMSTCWLLDCILTHDSAKITCIDPFTAPWGEYEHLFDANIAKSLASHKVEKLVGMSYEVLRQLDFDSYDFIYIDGSHFAADVLEDAILSFRLLKLGGIMILDDYDLIYPDNQTQNPQIGIDAFLSAFSPKLAVIHKSHQIILEKTLGKTTSNLVSQRISPLDGEKVDPISNLLGNMIPYPPANLCHSIGAVNLENFLIIADGWAQLVNRYIDKPSRVLDIGCGCGRMARLLVPNQLIVEYVGFDTLWESIDWCKRYITSRYPKARFFDFDIYSGEYNPTGQILGHQFVFPAEDNSIDVTFSGSVFTHLLYEDSMNYLGQIYRCLVPGGVGILSIHNQADKAQPFKGTEFRVDIEEDYFVEMCIQNGLKLRDKLGTLCGQEIFIVEK